MEWMMVEVKFDKKEKNFFIEVLSREVDALTSNIVNFGNILSMLNMVVVGLGKPKSKMSLEQLNILFQILDGVVNKSTDPTKSIAIKILAKLRVVQDEENKRLKELAQKVIMNNNIKNIKTKEAIAPN